MIEVNNLSFSYNYNNKKILKNISFKLFENERLCIIGPNGSGKTTLLKCLCNILDFQGSIFINNKNIKNIEVYKSVSFLSQSAEIYFDYNVFDTVMLGRYANFKDKLLSIPSKEDKDFIFECLEKLNIIHLKDKLINRLSGGELQKVFLARAFAQNPKIILMDEPTNHLDLNSQIELIYNLQEWVNKDFRCIIAVMHDINNALNFADKILLLHKGEIIYFGDIENFNLELLNNIYNINVVEYMRNSLKNIR